jgi:putative peptidoglycan lipid II flippase
MTGLVREVVMARLFGAGAVNDAFQVAFRIPNLTRDLFAEGALSSAFVPTFTHYLTDKGKREAAALASAVSGAIILTVGLLCAAGVIFTPEIVRLIAPGFERTPGKFELTVLLTRIMFPFLLAVALAAQAMGILNACGRFGVPALASAMFNVTSVVVGIALGWTVGRSFGNGPIVSMACGVLAGGGVQCLWQAPSLRRAGFRFRPHFDFAHPGLRQIGRLMVPAIIGNAAVQINVMVNTNLASGITDVSGGAMDGPVSWLGYAFRFLQLPLGVFGVAIASATLPAVSRSAAADRMEEFRGTLARSLEMSLLLTIPSSVGLVVLGESMIGAVYEGGRFRPVDTQQTAMALACYAVGLAGYATIKILAPAFYAMGDARTPMLVSVASVAVNMMAAFTLVKGTRLGHAGLALAPAMVALGGAGLLFALLRRRIGGIHGRHLVGSALKIVAASAAMGAVCSASSSAIHLAVSGRAAHLADVAVSIPLGVTVFYALARALRVEELEALRAACYTAIKNAPRPEAGGPTPGY